MPDRTFNGHVTEVGNSPIQTSTQNTGGQRQATTFKVVITLDEEVPDVRPGFTCTAEITTATRKNVVVGADPGAHRARDALQRQERAGARKATAAAARQCGRDAGLGLE